MAAYKREGQSQERFARIPVPEAEQDDGQSRTLRLLTLDEFVKQPQLAYHMRRLVPAGAIVVVFGAPKTGKTFAVCDLAMHAAHGMDWHGCKVTEQLRVVFLAGEGANGLRVRLRAWQRAHDRPEKPAFALFPEPFDLPEHDHEVIATLREFKPDLIVIDTLNAFFGTGDENSTQDMSLFVAAVRRLRDEFGCSVVIIHHTGVNETARERGSSVLRGAADVIVQVARDKWDSAVVGFQVIQARDLEPWDRPIALALEMVVTDWTDEEGIAQSTCIVRASNQPVTIRGSGSRPLGASQRQLVEIVQEMAATRANGSAHVLLDKADVAKVAVARGIPKQSVSSAWRPLAERGYWREIGAKAISVQPRSGAHASQCR